MAPVNEGRYKESVLLDWALRLLTAKEREIADVVVDGFGKAAAELSAQRVLAFRYLVESREAEATFEWSDGSAPSLLGALYSDREIPETMAAFRRGEVVTMTENDGLAAFPDLRLVITEQRTHGCILVPILEHQELTWVVAFEWRSHEPVVGKAELDYALRAAGVFSAGANRAEELAANAQAEARALARQKLETLGIMAGGVVHDFNNVLQVVLSLSEILAMRVDPGPVMALVEDISQTVRRAAELTQRFLVFSRQEVRKHQNVRVVHTLEQVLALLRRSIPENRVFQTDLPMEDVNIFMPRVEFEQAIVNVCNNASAALPQGGAIKISCRETGGETPAVEISISDDGTGMSPEVLRRACEPFFTTKKETEGTGLGLAMVKRTVENHGGSLRIESQEGKGTCVHLVFPISTRPDPPVEESNHIASTGNECVLVVEDEAMVRRVTASHLERANYTVLKAADGERALEIYREHRRDIALVLTDIIMPGMGGLDLYRVIASEGNPPPFLFTTGYDAGALSEEFLASPTRDLIMKPYGAQAMLSRVRALIDASQKQEPS